MAAHMNKLTVLSLAVMVALAGCSSDDDRNENNILAVDNQIAVGSEQCINGGVETQVGADTNNNDVLDSDEVNSTNLVCNAPATSLTSEQLASLTSNTWFSEAQTKLGAAQTASSNIVTESGKAKNVILFVGDGMGISTITAARILAGQLEGEMGEDHQLSFETMPFSGFVKTYNVDAQTPDSAGTMTAMASGVKTDAGVIGIDEAVERRRENPTNDALGLLVQTRDEEGNSLSNHELQSQTLLLLFAGHETSASMLTSLAMMLPKHPDVWQKLRDEQASLDIGESLTMENIKNMTYLEQVLRETERMFPPVPAGFRGVVKEFEFNGYRIPKGWTALYMINGGSHRDDSVFTEPNSFDPDRFSPERNEASVPFSLVGFGGGSRVCVGFAFAQLEMKILMSYLLRNYTWDLVEKQNLGTIYFPTLLPVDGMKVRFRRL